MAFLLSRGHARGVAHFRGLALLSLLVFPFSAMGLGLGTNTLFDTSPPQTHRLRRPDVVVDVFIPKRNFERFFRWYSHAFDFWPLWIVPYRAPEMYPWLDDGHQEKMGESFFIDCAVFGKPNSEPHIDHSEVLERKVLELGGIKTLISRNHYDRDTFWSICSQPRWQAIKERTGPSSLFGDFYARMHPQT